MGHNLKFMKKIKFIFVGGKKLGYESLKFLLRKKFRPICVVPNKDDIGVDTEFCKSVLKLSKKNKLKVLKLNNIYNFIKKGKIDIDLIFCLGSTLILPKKILNIPKMGAINIHPSLLPKYRGRYSLVHAIFKNEKTTGITIHWIGNKIDNGKIILQKKIKILNEDTSETLYKKFTDISITEIKKIFSKLSSNKKIISKDIKKYNTLYKKKHLPNFGQIDWKWNGRKIYNFFRSMLHEPFNPPEVKIGSKTYFLVSKKYIKKGKFLNSPL